MPEPTRGAHPHQLRDSLPSWPLTPAALPASQPHRFPRCAPQPSPARPSPAAQSRQRGRPPGAAAMLTEPRHGRKGKRRPLPTAQAQARGRGRRGGLGWAGLRAERRTRTRGPAGPGVHLDQGRPGRREASVAPRHGDGTGSAQTLSSP